MAFMNFLATGWLGIYAGYCPWPEGTYAFRKRWSCVGILTNEGFSYTQTSYSTYLAVTTQELLVLATVNLD